jgi:hypothetical protein
MGNDSEERLPAPQRHYTESSQQIFPEMKLRGFIPNSYIHVSVSDLYIPTIGLRILLQENRCVGIQMKMQQNIDY